MVGDNSPETKPATEFLSGVLLPGRSTDGGGQVIIAGVVGRLNVGPLDLGPFRILNPLPTYPPLSLLGLCAPILASSDCGSALGDLDTTRGEVVAAVLVSAGGGRMGAATSDDVVEDTDVEEDVEALRDTVGKRGKDEYGGVGGVEADGVGTGEG